MNHNTSTISPQKLRSKIVGAINECFFVPSYQRGYRWERKQVSQLLDDISRSGDNVYYLQPVVVAPNDKKGFDLIDGQQRLTTISLIYQLLVYKKQAFDQALALGLNIANPLDGYNVEVPYSIEYETRNSETSSFLTKIRQRKLEDLFEESRKTPDTLYMWHVCDEVNRWFGNDTRRLQDIADALNRRVKIIWYELEASVDCWEKFADLNVGKIPLTNSELIKALFMRNDNKNNISEHDKEVIVDQWDSVERELNNKQFWNFLTKRPMSDYDTKIDLLFDIVAGKSKDERDDFFTFLYFERRYEEKPNEFGKKAWNEIYLQYLRLRDWFEDPTNELYHKIGYLVNVDDKGEVLGSLFEYSKNKTQSELKDEINLRIKQTILLPTSESGHARIKHLSYGTHDSLIKNILTLFNVLTVQNMADKTQRYSFYHHNNVGGGWSLEHIHAQKSDVLNKEEQWTKWMELHHKSLGRYRNMKITTNAKQEVIDEIDKLDAEMAAFLNSAKKDRSQIAFTRISNRFAAVAVSDDKRTGTEYKDEMANLALLSKHINSLLSNSVFDVKRGLILEAISREFIPVCTQRVFLKAYTPQEENQLFFWGKNDRDAYIDKIESTIRDFLPDNYQTEAEVRSAVEEATTPPDNDPKDE